MTAQTGFLAATLVMLASYPTAVRGATCLDDPEVDLCDYLQSSTTTTTSAPPPGTCPDDPEVDLCDYLQSSTTTTTLAPSGTCLDDPELDLCDYMTTTTTSAPPPGTCPDDPEVDLCDYLLGIPATTTTTTGQQAEVSGAVRSGTSATLRLVLAIVLGASGHTLSKGAIALLPLLLNPLLAEAASSGTTCKHLKDMYKQEACCGAPTKEVEVQIVPDHIKTSTLIATQNPCAAKKPAAGTTIGGLGPFDNAACFKDGVAKQLEQAGGDVTATFKGTLNASGRVPLTKSYFSQGLCPVNVHWHLGAEHRSSGQYDEKGKSPGLAGTRATTNPNAGGRRLGAGERYGFACHHYAANDAKFTKKYDWKHCVGMHVGETYEVHWPHSKLGACHTPHQFQSPFYDGVFCNFAEAHAKAIVANAQVMIDHVGVQAQVFTIVNDEKYYYPNLMNGAIVDGDFWKDVAAYTGSTTGTSRNNKMCSGYTPITWQVDRKCHLISASSFDKMCADMKQNRDDMSSDLHAHGARELVLTNLTANNMAKFTR